MITLTNVSARERIYHCHSAIPKLLFHTPLSKVTSKIRRLSKSIPPSLFAYMQMHFSDEACSTPASSK